MGALRTSARRNLLLPLVLFSPLLGVDVSQAQTITLAEALNTTNLVWTTGGDSPWVAETTNSYDGISAACCVLSGTDLNGWLETTAFGPATLTFWQRDPGPRFEINPDPLQLPFPPQPGWPGAPPWHIAIYDLGEGTNVLRWTLSRISATNILSAVAYLDQVALTDPRPLQFDYQPISQTVYARAPISFWASGIGTPPVRFQWLKDNAEISAATNSWLSIGSTSTNDGGAYSVRISNSQNSVLSSNAVLTVLPPTAPLFDYEPQDQSVYVGQTAFLWASINGSPPFEYQWFRANTSLPGETNSWLSINSVQPSDGGIYQLRVTNSEGFAISSNAQLTVLWSAAPQITRQPRSLRIAAGSNPELSTEATGSPPPQFQWFKNGTEIPGARFSTLAFSNCTISAQGVYSVLISNFVGSAISKPGVVQVVPALASAGGWSQDVEGIEVTNDLAFLAQGQSGFGVLSFCNPTSPSLIGGLDTAGFATAVRVSGDVAFVSDGSAGLEIFNISNPSQPIPFGGFDTPGSASDLTLKGDLALVADWDSGLQIINVGDFLHPIKVGGFVTNLAAASVQVFGRYAFVGCPSVVSLPDQPMNPGLQILDISDPTAPDLKNIISLDVNSLALVGSTMASAGANSGVCFFDISTPETPLLLGRYVPPGLRPRLSAYDVKLAGKLAFVARGAEGLSIVDITDPTAPVEVAAFPSAGGFVQKLAVEKDRIYLAMGSAGLQIVNLPAGLGTQPSPAISITESNGLKLNLAGPEGTQFQVDYTDELSTAAWVSFQTVTLTNNTATIPLEESSTGSRFYRARISAP